MGTDGLTQTQTPALPTGSNSSGSRPWLALALTFFFLGIGYALPFPLAPASPPGLWHGSIAPEVLNLYSLTVFAGWAHFFYAWRGQFRGTARLPKSRHYGFWISVVISFGILASVRSLLGVALFSALVWIWFIAHFVKAELFFAGSQAKARFREKRFASWQPVAAFAWLTLVLFNVAGIQSRHWLLFLGCVALGLATLLTGGWQQLAQGTSFLPMLALFFDGEAFVWGTYGKYMHPAFQVGVYVFHVAGASFFHYLGSYSYGNGYRRTDRWLQIGWIVTMNVVFLCVGYAVAWLPSLGWLTPVIGLEWFTFWVAAHLAASDLLPIWKHRAPAPASH
ncbi:hypothetical protein [Acidicapsa ligni]|uniref:hypothetical protein n=1 Tax=Acidicapsa ligni TaxID=542300 RepID=UPI0021E092B1|nr:hypothetical protein [Acidicapsa ligni]